MPERFTESLRAASEPGWSKAVGHRFVKELFAGAVPDLVMARYLIQDHRFIEMSQSSWLVGGVLPGIERQPRKKLEPSPERLLSVLHRWRDEAVRAGRNITRIALAFEAGRDGVWLARWLEPRGVEAHVIHPSSVGVSREHRRAKTDRLDTELLKRGFLGWLRGERGHCSMVQVPTIAEEDAKRPNRERECLVKERTRFVNRMKGTLARLGIRNFKPTLRKAAERLVTLRTPEGSPLLPNVAAELERDMARLGLVMGQIKQIEDARRKRLEEEPESGPHAMVRLLARVVGVGIETADMRVHEALWRRMRDRRAVARYAGLTGAPDESGAKRGANQLNFIRCSSRKVLDRLQSISNSSFNMRCASTPRNATTPSRSSGAPATIRSLNRALVTASTRGCRPGRGRSRNPSMPSSS